MRSQEVTLMRRTIVAAAAAAGLLTLAVPSAGAQRGCTADWPMYGHDLQHHFAVPAGCSPITAGNVATLAPAWFFHTKDSITASPAVSDGTVYVGSWDGTFYAINADTGALRWSYHIATTSPSAFGRIVSSAAVVTAGTWAERRRVVIFGGGSSVWALDAATGHKLASIDLDPRNPADRKAAASDPRVVEVESSPAVVPAGRGSDDIYVGMDVHDEARVGRTGLVALSLEPGRRWSLQPRWKYDVETGRVYRGRRGLTVGSGHGLGCGGVWSSPAVDTERHLVVIGTASCDYPAKAYAEHRNYSEEMVALDSRSGHAVWSFRPEDSLPKAQRVAGAGKDTDFGASPNIFRLAGGRSVVGDGSKSAVYYVRSLRRGAAVTSRLAGQDGYLEGNFAVGGFIGSSAVEPGADDRAKAVIGGTAIPIPHSTGDVEHTTWDIRAINPQTGRINWVYQLGTPTYASTSVVNDVAFVPLTAQSDVVALDADTGLPLWVGPVVGPPSSTAVVAGDSVYLGTGTRETDLEYKAVNSNLQDALKDSVGESPLSPISGVQAFRLAADLAGS
jgi:outer membrane protein assembly factor BamB